MAAKYYIYRNLHTKTFSLKYRGKVIRHPTSCKMYNVEFRVSSKGQSRVRKQKRKNVHAMVAGTHLTHENNSAFSFDDFQRVYYDPYKNNTFVDQDGRPVYTAQEAICFNKEIYIKRF